MENTKEIQVLNESSRPAVGVYFQAENKKAVTNSKGIAVISVKDPRSLVKISRLGKPSFEVPFCELQTPIEYLKKEISCGGRPYSTEKGTVAQENTSSTEQTIITYEQQPRTENTAATATAPKSAGIIEKHWGWGVAAAAAILIMKK